MLVIYDKFNILKKMSHCSLVEYSTIYGLNKYAIILNKANRVIYDFGINKNSNFYEQVLQEQNNKFSHLISSVGFSIKLIGDFQLNNNEYVINIPYSANVNKIVSHSLIKN